MSLFHNSALVGASGQAGDAGYLIERSLRFNSSDSAYLSRTPASAGNRKTWTWAGWVKRSGLGGNHLLFDGPPEQNYCHIWITADALSFENYNTALATSSAVFRDASAWMHVVVAVDTTNSTSSDRIRLYVNGSRLSTSSYTAPALNSDLFLNQAKAHRIGSFGFTNTHYFSGYLADIHFIDGQALDPTSFGEFSATTGVWMPKAYTGTYGTNGFRLEFADNSSNTATTLGKDTSGNGNNWTPNNLSVTAGAGNDSLVDVPTNGAQTDTGVGGEVRGNYCTLNPTEGGATGLADGNIGFALGGAKSARGTFFVASGKWYFEILVQSGDNLQNFLCGIQRITGALNGYNPDLKGVYDGYGYIGGGSKYSGTTATSFGAGYGAGDIVGVAVDINDYKIWFSKNGAWQASGDPSAGTNPAFSGITAGAYSPFVSNQTFSNTHNGYVNFGQRPFAYTAPSGFKALCTANLPAPTIVKPSDVMDVVLYTGTGSALTPTSTLGFNPDLVWIKGRSGATDNTFYDSVRGAEKRLESNNTDDEVTSDGGVTAFNSGGFTLGTLAQVNTSSATYAAWCWDESVSAGFDIVTYTGNGSARTISHSLGVAPSLIIVKARTTASTNQGWPVYHAANTSDPKTDYLLLNSTAATADLDTVWNDTAPTSSVFSVGTNALVNANNDTYVAYLWAPVAGYSSFGSYTGNGSTDGPFVYTGFRPRWILIKSSSAANDWVVQDTARSAYNQIDARLFPNDSTDEISNGNGNLDATANGFKLRNAHISSNTNGTTYIYAAFAEHPFQYARAR
jgi:hypothetical protein